MVLTGAMIRAFKIPTEEPVGRLKIPRTAQARFRFEVQFTLVVASDPRQ
jgi:hypothetical protein